MRSIVLKRSLEQAKRIILQKVNKLSDPDLKITVWSVPGSSIPAYFSRLGYRHVTHVPSTPDIGSTDLLVSDGFHVMPDELTAWAVRMPSGSQLLLVHHPIRLRAALYSSDAVDPFEFGKARFHPISRWVDLIYGTDNMEFIHARPVVRIRRP